MMSFKCLCQTHQCPIIISSKPRQRRRRRDQAASVIARRPLIAAVGDVRTAPRLGCCLSVAAATAAAAMQWWQHRRQHSPNPPTFPFFLSLFASRSLCVQELCLVGGVQLTFLPFSLSLVPSLLPVSPHPSFLSLLCSSVAHPPSFFSFFFLSPSSLHSSLISLAGAPVLISPSSHDYSLP